MEISFLDLSGYRCPMTLLVAKRACLQLMDGNALKLLIADSASFNDISSFLKRHGFILRDTSEGETFVLYVQKLKGNSNA